MREKPNHTQLRLHNGGKKEAIYIRIPEITVIDTFANKLSQRSKLICLGIN